MEQLVAKWLKLLKIPVAEKYLERQLLSHPDYPSLLSITDTLGDLGIAHAAAEIKKEDLPEIPVPFITHLKGQQFVLVNSMNDIEHKHPDFFKRWEGVVLAAETGSMPPHKENEEYLKEERVQFWMMRAGCMAFGVLITAALVFSFSLQNSLLMLTALMGIFIAVLIVQKERGHSNKLIDQLCKTGKTTDCNAVLKSNPVGTGWLKFSDAGLIWFVTQVMMFTPAFGFGYSSAVAGVWSFMAVAAIPVTLFSVYYQWRVVKKWCTLCLALAAVLWLQAAMLLPVMVPVSFSAGVLKIVFVVAASFICAGAAWLLLRNLIGYADKTEKELYPALRFKRNPGIFQVLLKKQRRVNITPFENDLQLGNPFAPLQITVACNPYCSPCAKTHHLLHSMMEKHRDDAGLTVRFTVMADEKEDKKTQAVRYMLQYITANANGSEEKNRELKRTMLSDWFMEMDYEKFAAKHPLTMKTNVYSLLHEHEAWHKKTGIQFTPAIFINGYEMPRQYTAEDLPGLVHALLAGTEWYEDVREETADMV